MNHHNHLKKTTHIPEWELEFRADRASGPGGQNVNKTATKITVHFDIKRAKSLNEEQKSLVFRKLRNNINKEGELVLSEQSSRSQLQNRLNAVKKLENMIAEALVTEKNRIETKVPEFIREKRLDEKKLRSKKKEYRRKTGFDE